MPTYAPMDFRGFSVAARAPTASRMFCHSVSRSDDTTGSTSGFSGANVANASRIASAPSTWRSVAPTAFTSSMTTITILLFEPDHAGELGPGTAQGGGHVDHQGQAGGVGRPHALGRSGLPLKVKTSRSRPLRARSALLRGRSPLGSWRTRTLQGGRVGAVPLVRLRRPCPSSVPSRPGQAGALLGLARASPRTSLDELPKLPLRTSRASRGTPGTWC